MEEIKIMKILYVYTDLKIGGIQTQILEMCRYNSANIIRSKVLILTNKYDEGLLSELKKVADVVFLSDLINKKTINYKFLKVTNLFSPLLTYEQRALKELMCDVDSCHVMNLYTFYFISSLLSFRKIEPIKVTFGLYHANEVQAVDGDVIFYKHLINQVRIISPHSIVSTSKGISDNLATLGINVTELALGVPRLSKFKPKSKNKVISMLSVGRLVEFKTYNIHMVQLVEKFSKQGIHLSYTIIGDGPQYDKLATYITDKGLSQQVKIVKEVSYGELSRFIDEADVFIGSGTSLVLAAGRSCPALIGVESNPEKTTYGFLSDTKGADYNELSELYPKSPFEKFITSLLDSTDAEYNKLRLESYKRSFDFSIEKFMGKFIKINDSSPVYLGFTTYSMFKLYTALFASFFLDKLINNKKIAKKY
tara:strand:- start:1742 stop:3007 length:1266 start_codon:yes stop_codon:yes gene_type:complete